MQHGLVLCACVVRCVRACMCGGRCLPDLCTYCVRAWWEVWVQCGCCVCVLCGGVRVAIVCVLRACVRGMRARGRVLCVRVWPEVNTYIVCVCVCVCLSVCLSVSLLHDSAPGGGSICVRRTDTSWVCKACSLKQAGHVGSVMQPWSCGQPEAGWSRGQCEAALLMWAA